MENFDSSSALFLEWFKQQWGTEFHPSLRIVDLRDRDAGRGIIATEDIPADTDLFTIPRASVISTETSELAKKIPDLFSQDRLAISEGVQHDDDVSELPNAWLDLILALIYELLRKDTSKWAAYLSILPQKPQDFNTMMFWTETELVQLQASAMSSKIGRDSADRMFKDHIISVIKKYSDTFYPSSDPSTYLSDTQLLEACHIVGSLIMSYAFDLQPDDDDDDDNNPEGNETEDPAMPGWIEDKSKAPLMGMVPMADMLNADAEFNAHLSHGEQSLTMTSLRLIKAGEEVLNCYGPLPNGELLRRYGYTSSKHRRYDVVEISWDTVKQVLYDHKFENRLKAAASKNDAVTKFVARIEADDDNEVTEGFLLDRDSGEPNEEGQFSSEAQFTKFPDELVEVISELISTLSKTILGKRKLDEDAQKNLLKLEASGIMHEIVTARLGQYATSIADDEGLLSDSSLSLRSKMAIEVRLGEKKLLKEARDWVGEKQMSLASRRIETGRQKKMKR